MNRERNVDMKKVLQQISYRWEHISKLCKKAFKMMEFHTVPSFKKALQG
jgi:hypothetical protein